MSAAEILGKEKVVEQEKKTRSRSRKKKENEDKLLMDCKISDLIRAIEVWEFEKNRVIPKEQAIATSYPLPVSKLSIFVFDLKEENASNRLKKKLQNGWHVRMEIASQKWLILEKWEEVKVEVPEEQPTSKENVNNGN